MPLIRKGFISQTALSFVVEHIAELSVHCVEVTGTLEIDYNVRDYCTNPYPGHPEGCPHFGKRKECPPQAPLIEDFIDLSKPHYFIIVKYDCGHNSLEIPEKKEKTPDVWEEHMNPVLCEYIQEFQKTCPGTVFTLHPSAVGVDVFKTARKMGISLKSNPEKTLCKIALIGYPVVRDSDHE